MAELKGLPLELTAPLIQRLARKGLRQTLTEAERVCLCECVLFHADAILERRRIPRVGEPRRRDQDGVRG